MNPPRKRPGLQWAKLVILTTTVRLWGRLGGGPRSIAIRVHGGFLSSYNEVQLGSYTRSAETAAEVQETWLLARTSSLQTSGGAHHHPQLETLGP